MSSPRRQPAEEAPITRRVAQRPRLHAHRLRGVPIGHLGLRFLAGATTSVIAGILADTISPRVGGLLLAFPAILGASLTLIAEEEDKAEAREDCRGAVMGGCALAMFAGVAAETLGHLGSVAALLLSTCAWLTFALVGYLIAWYR